MRVQRTGWRSTTAPFAQANVWIDFGNQLLLLARLRQSDLVTPSLNQSDSITTALIWLLQLSRGVLRLFVVEMVEALV